MDRGNPPFCWMRRPRRPRRTFARCSVVLLNIDGYSRAFAGHSAPLCTTTGPRKQANTHTHNSIVRWWRQTHTTHCMVVGGEKQKNRRVNNRTQFLVDDDHLQIHTVYQLSRFNFSCTPTGTTGGASLLRPSGQMGFRFFAISHSHSRSAPTNERSNALGVFVRACVCPLTSFS